MKSSVKNIVDDAMLVLGAVFHKHQDFESIRLAMCVVMAKVIQATPDAGKELEIFDASSNDILHALEQLLQIEAAEKAKLAEKLDRGINGFAHLVEAGPVEILSDAGPALVGDIIEAANRLTEEEYEKLKEDVIKLHMPDEPTAKDENDVAKATEEVDWQFDDTLPEDDGKDEGQATKDA